MQVTPDLLTEEGYEYVMDFGTMDDQPVYMSTRSGKRLLAVPYAQASSQLLLNFNPPAGRFPVGIVLFDIWGILTKAHIKSRTQRLTFLAMRWAQARSTFAHKPPSC